MATVPDGRERLAMRAGLLARVGLEDFAGLDDERDDERDDDLLTIEPEPFVFDHLLMSVKALMISTEITLASKP